MVGSLTTQKKCNLGKQREVGGRGTYNWPHDCKYNPLIQPLRLGIVGIELELKASDKYPGPPGKRFALLVSFLARSVKNQLQGL